MSAPATAWSEKRQALSREGLGGSDAAAVLGLDKYRSGLAVWMGCTGRAEDEPQSEAAEWGTRLESEVLRRYAEDLAYPEVLIGRNREGDLAWYSAHEDGHVNVDPLTVGEYDRFAPLFDTLRHPGLPHLFAHIDGLVIDCVSLEVLRLVDAKTAGYWAAKREWGDEDTDETPERYIVQAHDYAGILALNGYPVPTCDVPALFGGQSYRCYSVPISTTLCRRIHERLDEWWREYVVTDTPPSASGLDNRLLGSLYAQDTGESLFAPEGLADWARALGEYRDAEKEVAGNRAECEARIKEALGEASEIVGEGWRCTWKRAKDGETVDWETAFRDVRAALSLMGDHALMDLFDDALKDHTDTKPGSRRLLTYGIAKTAREDG